MTGTTEVTEILNVGSSVSQLAPAEINQLGKIVNLGRDWEKKGENKDGENKGQETGKRITACIDLCLMLPGGTSQAAVCCSLQQQQDKKPDLLVDDQSQVRVCGQKDQ